MMADDKESKNTPKTKEKSANYDKRIKQYTLALAAILVVGLLISMFKTSNSPKVPPKVDSSTAQTIPTTNFAQQFQFEQNQLNAEKKRGQTTPGYNELYTSDDDTQWEKKEQIRALNSRQAGFGLNKNPINIVQANNGSSGNSAFPMMYQPQYSQNPYPPITQNYNVSGAAEPGATIVGRAVDDSYLAQQQGNNVLIPTGTIIDGVLDQDLISDYTGPWEGHLTQDVYSLDNQFILLPKGTKILGQSLHISNVNEPIQNRMGLTVEWAVLPNGKRIDFRKNAPADQAGVPAFEGSVNRHLLAQFLSVAAYALISAAGPRDQYNQNGYMQPTFKGQLAEGYREATLPFLMKYLSLVPTVTLHAGMPIKIYTQDDMYIKPWARVNTTIYASGN